MSRRRPTSPLAVTFFLVFLGVGLVPFLATPAAALGERVFESNTVISGTNHVTVDATDSAAQSFLASATYGLWNVTLRLRNPGDPTNSVTIRIRPDTGGIPSSSTVLASSTVTIGNTAVTNYPISFAARPVLTAGARYWIVATSSVFLNGYEWHHSGANTYPGSR